MIQFASRYASTANIDDDSCGFTCQSDYITFMPMPVTSKPCFAELTSSDQVLMTNDFTTRLYVSPPSVDSDCEDTLEMTVFERNNNVTGNTIKISHDGFSSIELSDKAEEVATTTKAGEMPMYRFGSIHIGPDNPTSASHFAHFVPTVQEWVTGKTQFYTLAKDCWLEFYTDIDGSDHDLIKIDNKNLSKYQFEQNTMNYFGKTFGHFMMSIKGYGLHTFENSGRYVLYIVCENVNGPNNAFGYLTGFNQRQSS
uniref:CUB domain-containing protein n=1 Tax=Rhabditophanes sp. KR3021 TaxID=114890 RepID=A0AC35TQQ0_9BILA